MTEYSADTIQRGKLTARLYRQWKAIEAAIAAGQEPQKGELTLDMAYAMLEVEVKGLAASVWRDLGIAPEQDKTEP